MLIPLSQGCKAFSFYCQVLILVSQCAVCTVMTIRVYALYCSDCRILWLFGVAFVFAAGLSGFVLSGQDKIRYPVLTVCHIGIPRPTAVRIVGLWWTLFAYDTIIFLLTVSRTYQFRHKTPLQQIRPSLFQDGAIYFAAMALVNLANIVTFYVCGYVLVCQLYLNDNVMPPHVKSSRVGGQYYDYAVHPTRNIVSMEGDDDGRK
ncbi:hypothetical protein MPER_09114 [Moniliophthora perniciosa FA553]|nr:hypothetical protein MPER_09114 [Moniliophthora perniciosa FA553]